MSKSSRKKYKLTVQNLSNELGIHILCAPLSPYPFSSPRAKRSGQSVG